jgi:photosystem II stability/assembly factor-like uncharacterized protein
VVWQVLSALSNDSRPLVAGRPLSNPHTHLHTIAQGGRPGVLYLGTHYGLFTSTDGGKTWPQSDGALSGFMVTSIAVSVAQPTVLGVIAIPRSGLAQMGIYFSHDGGRTFTFSVPHGLSLNAYPYVLKAGSASEGNFYVFYTFVNGAVLSLVASRTTPRLIYCGTDQGLYRWYDGSPSIARLMNLPMAPPTRLATDSTGKDLYAISGQDLWFSGNGGRNWVQRFQLNRGDLIAFLVDQENPNHRYAGFYFPPEVISTADGGRSWQILTA